MLLMLLPVSMVAQSTWSYYASGNVLSAYGESGYTAQSPLSITLNAPADLQFNGNYKPATISNTAAWEAAGLTVPTILYNGKTNAPSLLGTYTATISADGATAEVVYTIKTVIDFQSFFNNGITQGHNFDVIASTGAYEVGLNNTEQKGVWWDPVENCAVFDGEAYLQIDNPLGNVNANTGFTLTMDVWISSNNNSSGKFYRSTGAEVDKNGWQRLFDLSDGNVDHCIFINAGNANSGAAHLMWCLRKDQQSGKLEVWNNTNKSYYDQWCTITMVVAPRGYTTLYVNGEVLTHSSLGDVSKITDVLDLISGYNKCYIGTSIFEASGNNADGFFYGKIRGFQTAEGALMPYYDGSQYHYLLSYETNGGNPITGTFEATIPNPLPTPTHSNPSAVFQGWYMDEALTVPVTTGVTLTKNTSLYAKWNNSVEMTEGTVDAARWSISPISAPEGTTVTVNYSGDLCPDGVMIRQKTAQTIYMNNDNRTTAVNSYNATPNSRIELWGDLTATVTFTKEGEIDLRGHSSSQGFQFQHNTLGQTIIVKNGAIRYLDGNGGSSDYYKGTVVLENLTVANDVWTDGHAYIINGGTYSSIQNYKNSETPGTVTIYDGNFSAFNNVGGGTYTLYGGHYTFNPSSLSYCTIPSGYSVVDHGSGTYRYEVVCNTTPVLYPYDLTVTEVTPGRKWTFVMPRFNVEVDVDNIFCNAGSESDPYLVPSTEIWNFIVRKVNGGKTYTDKFFRQTADISVTQPIGNFVDNQSYNQKPFSGTYDGYGHTLNVNINTTGSFLGPFRCLNNATIKNLVVTGSVTAHARHASGLVGTLMGPCTLENCLVSTTISGTDFIGGLMGHSRLDGFTITGCVFNGTLNANSGGYVGGFTGWGGENVTPYVTITNCHFAGTYSGTSQFHPIGCFGGANATRTISNVYFATAPTSNMESNNMNIVKPLSYKGEFAYSITAGEGVTVAAAGTSTASYDVSKLNFYGENGFALNSVRYGGQGDVVSMNLTHADAPVDYSFSHYSADNGTLAGTDNPYTLTMASANSVINANYIIDEYRIDSIRTTWQVKIGNASPINPTPYVTENPTAADTMGYVMIPVNSEFVIIPSDGQKANVKKLELIDKTPPAGALSGKFTVNNSGKQVYFSQGNLQYTKSTGTWSFMSPQYNTVETNDQNVGDNYSNQNIVSLFGWGTSGYDGKYPYATSTGNSSYAAVDLAGTNYDWGVYNTITNGNTGWRTLTDSEWEYLLKTRSYTSLSYAMGTIHGTNGMIIFPDDFNPTAVGVTITSPNNGSSGYVSYSDADWTKMEAAGCVFLPAAGRRPYDSPTTVVNVGTNGYYWTTSIMSNWAAHWWYFSTSDPSPSNGYRSYGMSVRLVRNAE